MFEDPQTLHQRMKGYEASATSLRFNSGLPVYVRIDGKSFSHFTRRMPKPFCRYFTGLMRDTAKHLVEKTGARCCYTQSDEISLVFIAGEKENSSIFFDGKSYKLTSVLASMATAFFLAKGLDLWPDHCRDKLPVFDARVFELPSLSEAANAILWRANDCERNAVYAVAHAHFGAKATDYKNRRQLIEMLSEKGIALTDFPQENITGTFFRSVRRLRVLTEEELSRIPEAFRPEGPVSRNDVEAVVFPTSFRNIRNKEAFLFGGAEPDFSLSSQVTI